MRFQPYLVELHLSPNLSDVSLWFSTAISHSLKDHEQWLCSVSSNPNGYTLTVDIPKKDYRYNRVITKEDMTYYKNGPMDFICLVANAMAEEIRKRKKRVLP